MYLWAALALAACTGDDDAAWPEGGVPLELNAVVEGYEANGTRTRAATTENRWEGGERVRLWISNSISGRVEEIYSSVDSDGKLIVNLAWVSPDEEKGIQGVYPLSRNIVSFSVQADQSNEGYQDSDCMAAPYLRIAVTSPDKTLVFRHVTAKVVVHLKAGDGVDDDELRTATVTFENLTCKGGSSDFSNGTAEQETPGTDCIIELGGEDAKILFLTNGTEVRMNGSCAGGTGAFIDQMATLLKMGADEMDKAAQAATRTYTIASRCGVFAKSDIQPLLNQGAEKSDLAASIFHAVASQAITGLAKGRPISGNVLYLGGPLTFMSCLRDAFDSVLNIKGVCPENSLLYVAMGAAFCAEHDVDLTTLPEKLQTAAQHSFEHLPPLFKNEGEYTVFKMRHSKESVAIGTPAEAGEAFIGIDSGSTTIKIAVMSPDGKLLDSFYQSNKGNPVVAVRNYLTDFYTKYPNCRLLAGAVTGYGEELIRHGFGVDYGIVETMAHFYAAQYLEPEVDFILDIGGQDMKCLKIHNGAIDNIFLNAACSSGCGSFLQTFAEILGYTAEQFAQIGLKADMPVDLGSRCTVFMNSSVKQAQKDGASVANISAGLSISIVKNALYKVIRPASKEAIGKHIVVQGGTFLNDCVLRAFEQEMDLNVIRPNIAGLMGAYGAALYAQRRYKDAPHQTTLLNLQQLGEFVHTVKGMTCGLCNNHCHLTVNTFAGGKRFISGNRCERPITHMAPKDELNLYRQKLQLLKELPVNETPKRGIMGIPMGLNMYELLPYWNA